MAIAVPMYPAARPVPIPLPPTIPPPKYTPTETQFPAGSTIVTPAESQSTQTSSALSESSQSSFRQTTKSRQFFENTATSSTGNIVVAKIARDDGTGNIPGPQYGTIDYATGEVYFIPTDVIKATSFGIVSGGTVSQDLEESGGDSRSETNSGSNNHQVNGEGVAGATSQSTSESSSASSSSGGETTSSQGEWGSESFTDDWGDGSRILARYTSVGVTPTAVTETLPAQALRIMLNPYAADSIVPNSVRFTIGTALYADNAGEMIMDPDEDGVGLSAGSIDYTTGECLVWEWNGGENPVVTILSCLSWRGVAPAIGASMRTQTAPLVPESFQVTVTAADGELLIGTADEHGDINAEWITGKVNDEFGTAQLAFGQMGDDPTYTGEAPIPQVWLARPVDLSTLRYNAVAYTYLPLDSDILGIDPVRLPPDGRVPIYRDGDIVQIIHPDTKGPVTPTAGVAVSVGRTRLAWVRVIDADGETISGDLYTLDRALGTVTFPTLSGITTPVTIKHTVGDLRMVTDAQISGWLTLSRELTHNFPADESIVAGCLLFGDRRARVSATWDQTSWTNVWQDSIIGSPASATLNTIDFPITVTNEGCDTDRWVFTCTNATTNAWSLTSEKRGVVWSGTYTPGGDDVAPINARTRTWDTETGQWIGGTPYLTIPGFANGGGWSTGNCVRINTVGAIADFWIARSIQQSEEPLDDGYDSVEIYALGNVDRP